MKPAIMLLLLSGITTAANADTIPGEANKYRRDLNRLAVRTWGLGAPVTVLAGQVHQESRWNAGASSKYASGLAQFTPDTATWIARIYPDELGSAAPFSPLWALQALVRYDKHLYDRLGGNTDCDRWSFALRAYNGGLGYVLTEKKLAADAGDRDQVASQCYRAAWACRENLDYPEKIMDRWEPMYRKAGWSGQPPCR